MQYRVDQFAGGIVLYFWILTEGDQWIRNIVKKSLKVIAETRLLLRSNISFGIFEQTTVCVCTGEVSDTEVCARDDYAVAAVSYAIQSMVIGSAWDSAPQT